MKKIILSVSLLVPIFLCEASTKVQSASQQGGLTAETVIINQYSSPTPTRAPASLLSDEHKAKIQEMLSPYKGKPVDVGWNQASGRPGHEIATQIVLYAQSLGFEAGMSTVISGSVPYGVVFFAQPETGPRFEVGFVN